MGDEEAGKRPSENLGTIEYSKIQIDDEGIQKQGMMFCIPRGDDGQGAMIRYIVELSVPDGDIVDVREKIKRVLDGEEACPKCGWKVDIVGPIVHLIRGVRGGFECYCTYLRKEKHK